MMSFLGVVLILVAIAALLLGITLQKRYRRLCFWTSRLLISYVTIMVFLAGGELYFRFFYEDSAWPFSLAGEKWHKHYVHLNSAGFRDRDWRPEDYAGKKTVLAFGDSFTMGFGVENVEDRYTNVLARLVGPDYAVINIGVSNTTTRKQYDILVNYPLKDPDIIIWQYFLNDIDDAGLSIGDQWWPNLPTSRPRWIDESYLANFIYWRMVPLTRETTVSYWQWAYYAYDNTVIWQIHQQEIVQILDYIRGTGARLIVIVFPNLLEPLESIPYVDRVVQFLQAQGIEEVLPLYGDVSYFISREGLDNTIVSIRDNHPSAAFHRYLGQRIYNVFFATAEPTHQTAGAGSSTP